MDSVNKIEYKLRDLGTRSVTLFPTRGQVFREIRDVPLQAGVNQVTLIGLSPTIDPDSVKVEGSGAAIITDISVTQDANHEIFEDVYPEFDTVSETVPPVSGEDWFDEMLSKKDIPELVTAKEELEVLEDDLKRAEEDITNSEERLRILDNFGKSLGRKKGDLSIEENIEVYRKEREKTFDDKLTGQKRKREIEKSIRDANLKVQKFEARQNFEWAKMAQKKEESDKIKEKEEEKETRRKTQELKKKVRRRQELMNFWPRYVYSVCITLETNSYSPISSRRNSVASEIELAKAPQTPKTETEAGSSAPLCNLVLSYVTSSAFWAPSYDMQLSTTTATGSLLFDAKLHNTTSETWENCKIVLSTSQATATGLEDTTPRLVPWHIRLVHKGAQHMSKNDISKSKVERDQVLASKETQSATTSTPRSTMFVGAQSQSIPQPQGQLQGTQLQDYQTQLMLLEQQNKKRLVMARQEQDPASRAYQPQQAPQMQMQHAAYSSAPPPPAPSIVPASAPRIMSKRSRAAPSGALAETQAEPMDLATFDFDTFLGSNGGDAGFGAAGGDGETVFEPPPAIEFQDSFVEETGLTTTYDLPGFKTVQPTETPSKHRVARISFTNAVFSHTVIPKYKPVAHLKAKLRNTSKLTLLRGGLGLTLDGSFMGRTTLPRCSAGDSFSLALGIDPAIRVKYPGPDVRRATTGMFSKEDSSLYARLITLENTRHTAGKPVSILVQDQIPVSEDERLKVEVQTPRSLSVGGAVAAGTSEAKDWGTATASLKKSGEVSWDVKLNAGKTVRLPLEYVVAMPSGDVAVEV